MKPKLKVTVKQKAYLIKNAGEEIGEMFLGETCPGSLVDDLIADLYTPEASKYGGYPRSEEHQQAEALFEQLIEDPEVRVTIQSQIAAEAMRYLRNYFQKERARLAKVKKQEAKKHAKDSRRAGTGLRGVRSTGGARSR